MNSITVQDYIIDNFENDPLYKAIVSRKLNEELLSNCLLFKEFSIEEILNTESPKTVNTKRAAQLLELPPKKEQTLNNYLSKDEFREYVRVYRKGDRGLYRYDFDPLFRFKMILLLAQNGMQPSDISALLNGFSEALYSSANTTRISNKESNTQVVQTDQFMPVLQAINERVRNLEMVKVQYMKTDLKREIDSIDFKLSEIISNIERSEDEVESLEFENESLQYDIKYIEETSSRGFIAKLFNNQSGDKTTKIPIIKKRLENNWSRREKAQKKLDFYKQQVQELTKNKETIEKKLENIESKLENVNQETIPNSIEEFTILNNVE